MDLLRDHPWLIKVDPTRGPSARAFLPVSSVFRVRARFPKLTVAVIASLGVEDRWAPVTPVLFKALGNCCGLEMTVRNVVLFERKRVFEWPVADRTGESSRLSIWVVLNVLAERLSTVEGLFTTAAMMLSCLLRHGCGLRSEVW